MNFGYSSNPRRDGRGAPMPIKRKRRKKPKPKGRNTPAFDLHEIANFRPASVLGTLNPEVKPVPASQFPSSHSPPSPSSLFSSARTSTSSSSSSFISSSAPAMIPTTPPAIAPVPTPPSNPIIQRTHDKLQDIILQCNVLKTKQYESGIQVSSFREDLGKLHVQLTELNDSMAAQVKQTVGDVLAKFQETMDKKMRKNLNDVRNSSTVFGTATTELHLFNQPIPDRKYETRFKIKKGERVLLCYPPIEVSTDDKVWVMCRRVYANGSTQSYYVMFYDRKANMHAFKDFTFSI